MLPAGGKTTFSGTNYQAEITTLYLGRLLQPEGRGKSQNVIEVRPEADIEAAVDDIVVRFEDGHSEWMQVKENLDSSGGAWGKMWGHFAAQLDGMRHEEDRIVLILGFPQAWWISLRGLCLRANGARDGQEWLKAVDELNQEQTGLLKSIGKTLGKEREELYELLRRIEVRVIVADRVREDAGPGYMPESNRSKLELFDRLNGIVREAAERGKPIRTDWLVKKLRDEGVEIGAAGKPGERPAAPMECLPRAEYFKDREEELRKLLSDLKPGAVVEVCGPGGMGKTALAAEALHVLTDGGKKAPKVFPDGVVVHSFYKQADVNLAFEHILRSYEVEAKPTPVEAARTLLAGKQALLVLDGAEAALDLATLLERRGRCAVLLTSRRREAEAIRQDLPPLGQAESLELLQDWGGDWAKDETAGEKIYELVGGLPMALVLAGSYLCESDVTAKEYADWLERSPLQALDQGQRRMKSVPILMRQSLKNMSGEACEVLGAISLLAMDPFEKEWVGEALGMDDGEVMKAFGELSRYSLVRRGEDGNYQVSHVLIHTYVKDKLSGSQAWIGQALEGFCRLFERMMVEEQAKGKAGFDKLNRIRPNALAVVEQMTQAGRWVDGLRLAEKLNEYLDRAGFWSERKGLAEMEIEEARRSGLQQVECVWLNRIGLTYADFGQIADAIRTYENALVIARVIGDHGLEEAVLGNLGSTYYGLGKMKEAISIYEQALKIAREIGDQLGEGNALGNLGNVYRSLGQVDKAIESYNQALAIRRAIGDLQGEGNDTNNLGLTYMYLGQIEKAIDYYEKSLTLKIEIGDRRGEGNSLGNIGTAYTLLGRAEKAIEYYEKGLAIHKEIGDRRGEGNWLRGLADLFVSQGQAEKAIKNYEQALAIHREIGDRGGEGANLGSLGNSFMDLGQMQDAIGYYEQALMIHREIGDRGGEGADLVGLGNAYANLGQVEKSIENYEQALAIHREIGDRRGEGNALANLGLAYQKREGIDEACVVV